MQEADITQRDCDVLVIGGGRELQDFPLLGDACAFIVPVFPSVQPPPPANAASNP